MKYLKSYNERLSPSVYRSASRKLRKLNFEDRAEELDKHAREKSYEIVKNTYSKYDKVKFKLVDFKEDDYTISPELNFYPVITFDEGSQDFEEVDDDIYLNFFGSFIPADDEAVNWIKSYFNRWDEYFPNYCNFTFYFNIELKNMAYKINDVGFDCYDPEEFGGVIFNRKNGGVLVNLVRKIINDPNFDYPAYSTSDNNIYEELESYLIGNGISTNYGLEIKDLGEAVKKESINKLVASLNQTTLNTIKVKKVKKETKDKKEKGK